MPWYFVFFLISGFCSVLYEVIWLRLGMAHFGVTTPLISLVLSIFMLGLGLGSWGAGRVVKKWKGRLPFPALNLYAFAEILIGISALVVPAEFAWGKQLLERMGTHGLSSSSFYLTAGAWIALSLVPWCTCMGATFPLAMFAIGNRTGGEAKARSFSYLYLANVLGALMGAWVPLLIIELLGFRKTLLVGSALNFLLGVTALILARRLSSNHEPRVEHAALPAPSLSTRLSHRRPLLWLLFGTGLTSMAVEVIWVRLFTAWLGTVVYAFAAILAFYLGATYIGSLVYRRRLLSANLGQGLVWAVVGFTVILPLLAADPRMHLGVFRRVALGVIPLAGVLGFLTPLMVDEFSGGDAEWAGSAYAVNIVGCILGPLLAGFLLLPFAGERWSLCVLALPWFGVGLAAASSAFPLRKDQPLPNWRWASAGLIAVSLVVLLSTVGFETQFAHRWVERDYTATVVAKGDARLEKRLLVNGIGMTGLRPITKMMAHIPLAMLDRKPTNILIICFGMGTTHRSALSWGISSTVVELVPSVPKVFGYFHKDGPTLLQSPQSHLVVDDGRLFLERTSEQYDVIVVDPPPPVEAAGSSLLYSKEFYVLVKRHLRPDGILQQWLPGGEPMVQSSVTKALTESFPNLRVFVSIMDYGFHFLASESPLPSTSSEVLASRMPANAVVDMLEWGPESSPERQFAGLLQREVPVDQMIAKYPHAPAMEDNHPVNEYYFLRRHPRIFGRGLSGLAAGENIAQR